MNRGFKIFKKSPESIQKHLLDGSSKKVQLKIAGKSEKFYLFGKIDKIVSKDNIGYVNYLRINHPGEHWHGFVMERREDKQGLLFRFVSFYFFTFFVINFSPSSAQKCLRMNIQSSWNKKAKFFLTLLSQRKENEEQF